MDSQAAPATPADLPDITEYWPDAPHRLGPVADHYELPGAEPTRTGAGLPGAGPPRAGAGPSEAGPARAGADVSEAGPARAGAGLAEADQARGGRGSAAGAYPGSARPTLELHLAERPRHTFRRAAVLVAVVLVIGAVAAWAALRTDQEQARPPSFQPPAALTPANPPVEIGEPAPDPTPAIPDAATFELVDGTTEVNVTIGALPVESGPNGWFRVTSPDGSGVKPRAQLDGDTVKVFVEPTGPEGSARVDVLLSEDVTWSLRMRGGARVATFDLTRGTLGRLDLLGGTARTTLALPETGSPIPILMGGGVNTWRISTAGEIPVRAEFRKGAGTVAVYGKRDKGVAMGTTLTRGGGDGGIDLQAESGIGTLTVTARRP
ncbi:hypothetical protein AB0F72_31055 [Actinoplanes sp. NPDC023936]|uniref:hypothetical protein n=1 Tax=Actinoplanes sp. NPDC023936 TaxID=3154910 RepID=UPI0033F88CDB